MRAIQLISPRGVEETFITEERHDLAIFNVMLKPYDLELVEGAGAVSESIGDVVRQVIEKVVRERALDVIATATASGTALPPLEVPLGATGSYALDTGRPAPVAPEVAAPIARAPNHVDPRASALGSGNAPMPHKGEGPTASPVPEHLLIRPGQADGLGSSQVFEATAAGVVKAPAWRPKQFEDQEVERVPGAREAVDE